MGQQQLLLIVLGVIIVGIAVAVGITMFGEQSASANLDAVVGDLQRLAARAHQYYIKPTSMAGGGKSFVGLTADVAGIAKLTAAADNDNGTYTVSTAGTATAVVLQGVGKEDGDGDGTYVTVYMYARTAAAGGDSTAIQNR